MKTPRWSSIVCVLLVALMVAGSFTLWLFTRRPVNTDPSAPFHDLTYAEKARIIDAVEEELSQQNYIGFWYGETPPEAAAKYRPNTYLHGIRYYGTFGGYDIILVPKYSNQLPGGHRNIAGYHFWYEIPFLLYAHRNGTLAYLTDAYKDGLFTKSQIAQIHQCFEVYNEEVYLAAD